MGETDNRLSALSSVCNSENYDPSCQFLKGAAEALLLSSSWWHGESHNTLFHVVELLAALAHCHNIFPDCICSHMLSISVKYAFELLKLI
jgi:hypothetical protein